ncbi:MAG: proline--tRNA ligase, partial [Spirochaetia bacterium]
LPLGVRVTERLCRMIREEMNRLGGQEVLVPLVNPAELWQTSGRDALLHEDMVRFKDRHGHNMVLAPTHEEAMVELVRRRMSSYRSLPLLLYQFQLKFRDEERPSGGLVRAREFLMKDGYSFHKSFAELNNFFPKVFQAYERLFIRCGIHAISADSGVGFMGGDRAYEFLFLSKSGDDRVIICDGCGYTANFEVALGQAENDREAPREIELVHTPGRRTTAHLAAFLELPLRKLAKPMVFSDAMGAVMAVVRGDHEVSVEKLSRLLGRPTLRKASLEKLAALGFIPGSLSPLGEIGSRIPSVVDPACANNPNMVYGSNEQDYHYLNVNFGRDFASERVADIARINETHSCIHCGTPLKNRPATELGNIFRLGTAYSRAMGLSVQNERGERCFPYMGSYGIGVGRLMSAVVEAGADKDGIVWPEALAPFGAYLMGVGKSPNVARAAEDLYQKLGADVLFDDRHESVSRKFKDADLIGIPYRIIVSQATVRDGTVEVRSRADGTEDVLTIEQTIEFVRDRYLRHRHGDDT